MIPPRRRSETGSEAFAWIRVCQLAAGDPVEVDGKKQSASGVEIDSRSLERLRVALGGC